MPGSGSDQAQARGPKRLSRFDKVWFAGCWLCFALAVAMFACDEQCRWTAGPFRFRSADGVAACMPVGFWFPEETVVVDSAYWGPPTLGRRAGMAAELRIPADQAKAWLAEQPCEPCRESDVGQCSNLHWQIREWWESQGATCEQQTDVTRHMSLTSNYGAMLQVRWGPDHAKVLVVVPRVKRVLP